MSDEDIYAVEVLSKCNIKPTTVTKRWITFMLHVAKTTRLTTQYQIDEIWRILYNFKNQIKDKKLIEEARKRL